MNPILTVRQKTLLSILSTREEIVPGRELAVRLNVSARTIRSDIRQINLAISPPPL